MHIQLFVNLFVYFFIFLLWCTWWRTNTFATHRVFVSLLPFVPTLKDPWHGYPLTFGGSGGMGEVGLVDAWGMPVCVKLKGALPEGEGSVTMCRHYTWYHWAWLFGVAVRVQVWYSVDPGPCPANIMHTEMCVFILFGDIFCLYNRNWGTARSAWWKWCGRQKCRFL